MHYISKKDIAVNGITYRVLHVTDTHMGAPWNVNDGEGIVSDWVKRAKKPGELVLGTDGTYGRFFDLSGTIKKAKSEHWGAPEGVKTDGMTPNQIAHAAAMANFKRLKAYWDDEWGYVGVVVYPLTVDGDELKSKTESVWGIESDDKASLESVALELIADIEAKSAIKNNQIVKG